MSGKMCIVGEVQKSDELPKDLRHASGVPTIYVLYLLKKNEFTFKISSSTRSTTNPKTYYLIAENTLRMYL